MFSATLAHKRRPVSYTQKIMGYFAKFAKKTPKNPNLITNDGFEMARNWGFQKYPVFMEIWVTITFLLTCPKLFGHIFIAT